MQENNLSLRRILLKLAQALGFVKGSISISKSRIAAAIFFSLGPIKKVWFSTHEEFTLAGNRSERIRLFLQEIRKKFHLSGHIDWILGLEGSGILVRIMDVEVSPDYARLLCPALGNYTAKR